ncbi:hypothetical protein [Photobacterium lutimaris]|uniref:Uncharacterized protein n=1 Tax=Photobacterium lutimaris TaxID=388278 RepID=A0A2T3IYW3_9GAMM|nr:hypothetical protein [Photobacterium lutimaris]PSU33861.1 hypothetical protein C9I99_10845 [Photobacterium lutimaris]TDR76186.1 hypothetical protein DFP78_103181 [Photobacterium lutimaris]
MNYIAIFLDDKGRALSNNSGQYINIQLGMFDDISQATDSARDLFGGHEIKKGLIWNSSRSGGVLITTDTY